MVSVIGSRDAFPFNLYQQLVETHNNMTSKVVTRRVIV
jgi:hypothetical protein